MTSAVVPEPGIESPRVSPAPRLLKAGIDVLSIEREPLPDELWKEIDSLAMSCRGDTARWELTCSLYQSCRDRLADGEEVSGIVEWLRHRAVRRLLCSSAAVRGAVVDTHLPAPLLEQVDQVRRRLRWWLPGRLRREEQVEGVVELCERLSRELKAGKSVEQLHRQGASSFYREARRGQLAKRWWISRAVRLVSLSVLWLVLGTILIWGTLSWRLNSARTAGGRDVIDRFDDSNRQFSADDRAWPAVRDLHIASTSSLNAAATGSASPLAYQVQLALTEGPTHAQWEEARGQLATLRAEVDRVIDAVERPGLGHLYRDDGDSAWYRVQGFNDWRQFYQPGMSMFNAPMFHMSAYSIARAYLIGAFHLAVAGKDTPRACQVLRAQIRLSLLISKSHDFAMVQSMMSPSVAAVTQINALLQNPDMPLTAGQMAALRDVLREFDSLGNDSAESVGELLRAELRSLYSDDGSQGRVTRQGLEAIRFGVNIDPRLLPVVEWLGDPRPPRVPPYTPPQDWTFLFGPLIAPLMISREEAEAILTELLEAQELERQAPPGDPDAVALDDALDRLTRSDFSTIRHSPVLLVMSTSKSIVNMSGINSNSDLFAGERRAVILRLALEIHRLRTGAYPETASELIPEELPELPRDPYDTQPLRYRLIEGRPLIYSIGLDGIDQTAGQTISPDLPAKSRWVHEKDLQYLPQVDAETSPGGTGPAK